MEGGHPRDLAGDSPIEIQSMGRTRILVVDDSAVIRKLLSDALNQDPELEVVGTAGDGRIALAKIAQLNPELVTLDVEMPLMNGLETLAEIRKTNPRVPIIMFSTLTERGAAGTLEALSRGASDYATKPSGSLGPAAAIDLVRMELIPKIKALCARRKPSTATSGFVAAEKTPRKPRARLSVKRRIEVVAIGVSTGGPQALSELFPRFPKEMPVPIVVVQHMPPIFTRLLAERLASKSKIAVEEASDGARVQPGKAWIAPGNFHMTVTHTLMEERLKLNQDAPENSCRPAVDVLFRSVAASYGTGALAVVMTGMGSDGVIGARLIHDSGGEVIVQDERSSVVWGMPGLVHAAGEADAVYPLGHLADEIVRRVMQGRSSALSIETGDRAEEQPIK